MAYQGSQPAELAGKVSNIQIIDDISSSFDGSTTTFALTSSGAVFHALTARSIIVVLGGIIQEPGVDYTVDGQNLTFTTAPVAGLTFACRNVYGLNYINGVNDGVVTPAKLSTGGPSWTTTGELNVIGVSTFNSDVNLLDNDNLYLGTNQDLRIYHSGSNAIIRNNTGGLFIDNEVDNGDITIRTDDGSGGTTEYIQCDGSRGAVELYHYGTQKFETTASGINVTGAVNIDSTTSNTPLVVEASQNNRSRIVFRNDTETGTECNIELIDEDLRFVTNSGERIRITRDGNIGIGGVTDPKTRLHLADGDMSLANNDFIGFNLYYSSGWKQIESGTTAAVKHHNVDGLQLYSGADSGNGADGAALAQPRLTVTHDGNVGIGSVSPGDKLVVHQGSDDDIIVRVNGADATTEFAGLGVGAGYASFVAGGSQTTNTDMVLMTTSAGIETEQARILSSGGITFNGDTSTNNALDDYEIGTFVSTITIGSGSITSTNANTLSYVKIGNLVHVQGRVYVLMNTSDCSSFSFTLPFANTQNLASDAEDTSVPVTVIRSTATGGMPAGIRSFRFGGGSATISMQNADGGPTGNFGTSSPHINVNVQYRTYQ